MRWGRGLNELDPRSVARPTPHGSTDGRRVLLALRVRHTAFGWVVGLRQSRSQARCFVTARTVVGAAVRRLIARSIDLRRAH